MISGHDIEALSETRIKPGDWVTYYPGNGYASYRVIVKNVIEDVAKLQNDDEILLDTFKSRIHPQAFIQPIRPKCPI